MSLDLRPVEAELGVQRRTVIPRSRAFKGVSVSVIGDEASNQTNSLKVRSVVKPSHCESSEL